MNYTFFKKIFPPHLTYRNFIFIPVFFSFYIVLHVFNGLTFELGGFAGRCISLATFESLDISARVTLFYRAIFFGLLLLLLFTRIILIIRQFVTDEELKIANGLSLAGLCLLYFQLLGAEMKPSLNVLFALLIICLSGFVYHQVKKRDNKNFSVVFLWSTIISVSLFFLLHQICILTGIPHKFSLPKVIVGAGIPLYLVFTNKLALTNKWLKATHAFVYLPLLSFISVELFLIFNQRGLKIDPLAIYVFGLALIAFRFLTEYFKSVVASHEPIQVDVLFRRWMPWTIAGIACIALYQPIVQPEIDWFESANNVLPLQQWFEFGKIPFLDIYSSHALSDFGFGILYSALNGADPLGGFVYRFLMNVLVILIVYFFLYKITEDGYLSTWIVLAFPYSDLLIPSYYNFVPLAALSFILLYSRQTTSRYAFFFGTILLMPLWRVDLGLSTLIAGISGLLILILFVPTFKPDYKKLFRGLSFVLLSLFILFVFAFLLRGIHLFTSLKDALAYMSSFQSYGLKDLTYSKDVKYFTLYFLLPAIVLTGLLYAVFSFVRERVKSKHETYILLAIIFLGIFYIANLQRGLVRHTLAEQWDTALTSYGYLVVTLLLWVRFIDKNKFFRFLVFFALSTVITGNYVLNSPGLQTNNFYSVLNDKIKNPPTVPSIAGKIERTIENPSYKRSYEDFSNWMKKSFPAGATFLDFSNTPMLYFFTNRELPNYLAQIPHTAHNDYLQERFLEDLKNYDIPVVVFSNTPQTFWDNLDGIPNCIRHYKISEYIYRNYSPAYIMNNHCIWIKKQLAPAREKELMTVSISDMLLRDTEVSNGNSYFSPSGNGRLIYTFNQPLKYAGKKISYLFNVDAAADCEIKTGYKSPGENYDEKQSMTFKLHSGLNEVYVMTSSDAKEKEIRELFIDLPQGIRLNFSELKFFVSDHFQDRVSVRPSEYSLKWLPYIWGKYDRNFSSGKIAMEQNIVSGKRMFGANAVTSLSFEPVRNKEYGNYIKVSARTPSGKQTNLIMSYGDTAGQNGSFIFNMKNDSLFHDYLIRTSAQYNWYNKSNNWLRFYPVENEIEINSISIFKGD